MCSTTMRVFICVVFLVLMMTMFQGSFGIGLIYCFKPEECPRIQRIPYDIPPVAPEPNVEGFLENVKSILQGYDFLKQNESKGENTHVAIKQKPTRIRSLELVYYHYLPTDSVFLSIIGALILIGILGSYFD